MFMEVMDWGCYRNNKKWITDARRFYMESIMFNIFSDLIPAEFERWATEVPYLGFHYHCPLFASLIWIAEMSKRYGDSGALYNFTTSYGVQGSGGGPKNLLMSMEKMCDMMLGNIAFYGTDQASCAGKPAYLCRLRPDSDHWNTYLVANNHFKSQKIRNALMRIGTLPDSGFQPDMKGDADREHQKQPFGAGWSTYWFYGLRDGKNDKLTNPLCYPVV